MYRYQYIYTHMYVYTYGHIHMHVIHIRTYISHKNVYIKHILVYCVSLSYFQSLLTTRVPIVVCRQDTLNGNISCIWDSLYSMTLFLPRPLSYHWSIRLVGRLLLLPTVLFLSRIYKRNKGLWKNSYKDTERTHHR